MSSLFLPNPAILVHRLLTHRVHAAHVGQDLFLRAREIVPFPDGHFNRSQWRHPLVEYHGCADARGPMDGSVGTLVCAAVETPRRNGKEDDVDDALPKTGEHEELVFGFHFGETSSWPDGIV